MLHACDMAKPYWRVKRGNKNTGYRWVWEPAKVLIFNRFTETVQIEMPKEEEEE